MAPIMHLRNTVDRLDRPSSYALGKKKRYIRAPDDTREPAPEPEDKLKDATTLYVGNL